MREAEEWLRAWASWMRADHAEIESMCGYPSSSAGFSTGGGSSGDAFDHLVEWADGRMIGLVDSAVRQLDGPHYCAVANRWLACVWRYRGDPAEIYREAVGQIWARVSRSI